MRGKGRGEIERERRRGKSGKGSRKVEERGRKGEIRVPLF